MIRKRYNVNIRRVLRIPPDNEHHNRLRTNSDNMSLIFDNQIRFHMRHTFALRREVRGLGCYNKRNDWAKALRIQGRWNVHCTT